MTWKRTIILLAFMLLAGYLASIRYDKADTMLSSVGTAIAFYFGVKGKSG